MESNNFSSSISVPLSAKEVIQKISQIPEWWGVTFSGSSKKKDDTFTLKMTGDSFFNLTVSELIPEQRMVWLVTDCNMPWYEDKKEWSGTRLIFDLTQKNAITDLTFTHEGLTPNKQCYEDCALGWTHWIKTSLFSYITTGKGVFRAPTK
jgi:hypothetical protein